MPSYKTKSSAEIQRKNVEVRKKEESDDSESDDIEADKRQVDVLFKNYQGSEKDVERIMQFLESGENMDCLICNFIVHLKLICS